VLRCADCWAANPDDRTVCHACGEWLRPVAYGTPPSPDGRKFGWVAVDRGLLSPEQVAHAMAIQLIEDCANLPHRPLGAVCRDEGYLTPAQVQEVLESQCRMTAHRAAGGHTCSGPTSRAA